MSLTPMDIHNKEFDIKLRGYDESQVDSFLDRIVDAFGDALDKNIDLTNSNNELKKKNQELEAKIEEYEKIKDSLNQSLISAQANADEVKQKAQAEADQILSDAQQSADDKTKDLKEQYNILNNDYELLKGKVADFRAQTKKLLQDQLDELDDNDWQYYLDKYYGRSRLYPADGSQPVLVDDQEAEENSEVDNQVSEQTQAENESAANDDSQAATEDQAVTETQGSSISVSVSTGDDSQSADKVDKDQTNEVNSNQGTQDDQPKILEGDSPSSEDDGVRKQATPAPSDGPTIIFPDDYKNHN